MVWFPVLNLYIYNTVTEDEIVRPREIEYCYEIVVSPSNIKEVNFIKLYPHVKY